MIKSWRLTWLKTLSILSHLVFIFLITRKMKKGYLVESETYTIECNTMIWNRQPYKKCKITTTYLLGLFYLKNFNCLQKHNQTYSDTEEKFEVYSLFLKFDHMVMVKYIILFIISRHKIVVFTSTTCNQLTRHFFRAKSFMKARKRLMYISNFKLCIHTHVRYTWYATSTTVKNMFDFLTGNHKFIMTFWMNS